MQAAYKAAQKYSPHDAVRLADEIHRREHGYAPVDALTRPRAAVDTPALLPESVVARLKAMGPEKTLQAIRESRTMRPMTPKEFAKRYPGESYDDYMQFRAWAHFNPSMKYVGTNQPRATSPLRPMDSISKIPPLYVGGAIPPPPDGSAIVPVQQPAPSKSQGWGDNDPIVALAPATATAAPKQGGNWGDNDPILVPAPAADNTTPSFLQAGVLPLLIAAAVAIGCGSLWTFFHTRPRPKEETERHDRPSMPNTADGRG